MTEDGGSAGTSLQVEEQHYRLLVESVRDYAIFLLDPAGNVASWNPGAERAKGYRADEIIGRHFSAFYPEEDLRSGKCAMELEVAAREGRFEDEGFRKRKDGTLFWANVVITALRGPDGALVGFGKVTRDLTERRAAEDERVRLEAEKQAREAADAANRAKDEFLAHISHELRTPLNAILGWSRLISGGLDAERQARAVATVERNAEAMARLIEDLLDVSRIVSGKMRLEVSSVDLPLVIERATDAVRLGAEAKNIRIHALVDSSAGPILGDAGRLQQVVWNLLSNAVKFTPKNGWIRIVLRREGSHLVLSVQDSGIGLQPESLGHVFSPFWQASPSHSTGGRGLGLGLAIVRSIVELHGGRAEVRSDGLGTGSTFDLYLPFGAVRVDTTRPPATTTTTSEAPASSRLSGLRILVVEDDDDARELVRVLLEQSGLSVRTAASVRAALAAFEEEVPQLLVSDIGLPDGDGYALIQRIRAREPAHGGRVPAVALTAYARTEDRTKALVAGFNMHVAKPVEASELITVLTSLAVSFRVEASR